MLAAQSRDSSTQEPVIKPVCYGTASRLDSGAPLTRFVPLSHPHTFGTWDNASFRGLNMIVLLVVISCSQQALEFRVVLDRLKSDRSRSLATVFQQSTATDL